VLPFAITEEPDGVLFSSIVGVKGAVTEFDNLLGWCETEEVDRTRRCVIMLPEGLIVTFSFLETFGESGLGEPGISKRESVGVGGVTVVTGVEINAAGGVSGLLSVSNCGIDLIEAVEDSGGAIRAGSFGTSGSTTGIV
jgi:hypothetical protein